MQLSCSLDPGPGFDNVPTVDPGVGLSGSAVGAFLSTLLGGTILVALALLMVLLAITIVGIIVVIPLAIVVGLAWAAGASVAFLAIADRLVGREDGWLKPLLVAALFNGGLVSFAVGAAGFGALLRDWQE
jgi:hypothetical protein